MRHHNNFDFLRVVAAFAVLVSHQYALSGRQEPLLTSTHTLGNMGVAVFFSISGFLIAASWRREPAFWRFATKRLLRIWPAFVVCLLVVGVVAAIAMPQKWHDALLYVRVNLLLGRRDGGFFPDQPHSELNGSLWTIRIELLCYAMLALLAWVARRFTAVVLGSMVVLCGVCMLIISGSNVHHVNYTLWYMAIFCVGAWLQFAAGSVWLRGALGVAGTALLLAGQPTLGLLLLVPAVVVTIGPMSWPVMRRFGRFGDFSYGLYLWAWPVQQSVIWFLGAEAPIETLILASASVTLVIAFASWHGIEKRALAWAPRRTPGGASPGFAGRSMARFAARRRPPPSRPGRP